MLLHFELILPEWEFVILIGGNETSKMSSTLLLFIIVNERHPSTEGFYKYEIPIEEFIISRSFIHTKNELLHRLFMVFSPSCRTTILQNISWRLLLKQTAENYLTHLQPMFHVNPLIPTENIRK